MQEVLSLLQLASPGLPVGSYSYSEGLETLIATGIINNQEKLWHWLQQELNYGAVRLEAAVMLRVYRSINSEDFLALNNWNLWLSAARETRELRQQSWQMGQSLFKLLMELEPQLRSILSSLEQPCNYAVAFAIAAATWKIDEAKMIMGYLHSWLSNLINAGVKSIPLGQTVGQKLLFNAQELLIKVTEELLSIEDEELATCGWGLALASMVHETQYTRLFRS